MTYDQMLQKLYGLKGSGLDLERILALLGDPHRRLRAVRIAGTNGKGSVSAFLAQILQESGYRVGLFTSPHLIAPEERIQINRRPIPSEEFQREFERVWFAIEQLYGAESEQRARFFEVLTLMALDYFAHQHVDYAVIECGVGARRDATRVIASTVSVLTNVALDHVETLGPTIAQIAYEKSAVVAEGGVLITGESQPDALREIEREVLRKKAQLRRLDLEKISLVHQDWDGQIFRWHSWKDVRIGMLGAHQCANAVLALEAALALHDPHIDERALRAGLEKTRWPGRMELLRKKPYVMLDGAKNPAGLSALRQALQRLSFERLLLVMGISDRKDVDAMLDAILPIADEVIATQAEFRGISAEFLAQRVREYGRRCRGIPQPSEALEATLAQADDEDLVCVTGSLFLVGAAKAWWDKRQTNYDGSSDD
ncbi:MAG: bifunctional folylpolyglutamate synthase/dihydrofolate synthase [Candidatus Bipolaricaulota bacterium]|nr:bifunctional folylpolyglutamate synthase/dihydrofolate synthase [Candidatus Bipolaricaulota bacterium]MDW8110086.1 folylpolyglutamate synthase/dihydrofolate synthase family protein [Candidatus Bipolaricaulota bacterium]MDW8328994.1 folylpolyglutamate synthase/dihydrofolate synthase family protein [Candidatus Bipolaricaulota bacterium]